jgi:cytosine deaminase
MDCVIKNVRLRKQEGAWNVGLRNGRIAELSQGPVLGDEYIEADGRLLTPGLVETHLHMDKTLTAGRIDWSMERPSRPKFREFQARVMAELKRSFTREDIRDRALRLAKMASAAGTTAIRAQCDVDGLLNLTAIEALLEVKEEVRDLLDLQIIAFPAGNLLEEPELVELLRRSLELGAHGVGGIPEIVPDRVDEYIDKIFRVAAEGDGVVDLHIDQPDDERLFSFPILVEKAREYGLEGRVTGAHSNSLAYQPVERVRPVLEEMREVGIHLSCLPYSLVEGRIKRPKSVGVNVSLINDNVRDAYQRGGQADLVQMAMIYARTGVVRTDAGLDDAFDMITHDGARLMELEDYGMHVGAAADLCLFDAQTVQEVICHHIRPTLVFKRGRVVNQ